jgi:hypothetical protein
VSIVLLNSRQSNRGSQGHLLNGQEEFMVRFCRAMKGGGSLAFSWMGIMICKPYLFWLAGIFQGFGEGICSRQVEAQRYILGIIGSCGSVHKLRMERWT